MATKEDYGGIISNKSLQIPYGNKLMDAVLTIPERSRDVGVVFTHGAGGDMNTQQIVHTSEGLASRGFVVLRFTCKGLNLKYRTKVFTEMVIYMKQSIDGVKSCLVGGRSMGSRAALEVANQRRASELEDFIKGVICVSYPLYPPGAKDKIRDAPLYDIDLPIICLSGTRDDMCERSTFEEVMSKVTSAKVLWLEGTDHSLSLRNTEKTKEFIIEGICDWFTKNFDVPDERKKDVKCGNDEVKKRTLEQPETVITKKLRNRTTKQ